MNIRLLAVLGLLCPTLASAEVRTFTNATGKKINAELIGMEKETALLKLANGRTAKVPLKSLSEADQSYVKTWYEENKDKVNAGDIRMSIKKNTERLKEPRKKDDEKGKKNNNKSNKTETSFTCNFENLSSKAIEGLKATCIIYERVSVRGDSGSETLVEETTTLGEIATLEPRGKVAFTSESEISEDSETKKKDASQSRRETVVGFVVTIKHGERELLKQSYPDNFLQRLEEAAKRKAAREK